MENSYPYRFYPPYGFSPFYNRNKRNFYKPNKKNEDINKKMQYEKSKNSDDEKIYKTQNKPLYSSTPIFELFGIQLYFDDILLISLIFFLYNEGVQDQFLLITLILLLLS